MKALGDFLFAADTETFINLFHQYYNPAFFLPNPNFVPNPTSINDKKNPYYLPWLHVKEIRENMRRRFKNMWGMELPFDVRPQNG